MQAKFSYANVMATIAVFIALGGGAYAATHLPKNSVGPKQIEKNAVNGSKVAEDSLTGADVRESSLGAVPKANRATNSDALKGHPPTDFLGTSATAVNSSKLGGLSPSAFVQGNGQLRQPKAT